MYFFPSFTRSGSWTRRWMSGSGGGEGGRVDVIKDENQVFLNASWSES